MFILKKILNAPHNCAEPIRMPTESSVAYVCGALLKLSSDGTMVDITAGDKPTHVCIENLNRGAGRTVLCYKLFPNMIFEVKLNGTPHNDIVGRKLSVAFTNGHASAITSDETNGVATVYSLGSANDEGDNVLVYFEN